MTDAERLAKAAREQGVRMLALALGKKMQDNNVLDLSFEQMKDVVDDVLGEIQRQKP